MDNREAKRQVEIERLAAEEMWIGVVFDDPDADDKQTKSKYSV